MTRRGSGSTNSTEAEFVVLFVSSRVTTLPGRCPVVDILYRLYCNPNLKRFITGFVGGIQGSLVTRAFFL